MAKQVLLAFLRTFMVLTATAWVTLWFLKPTDVWTRKWREFEDSMQTTIFDYNGANFMVYTFPIILLAMLGSIYLYLQPRSTIRRQGRRYAKALSNPLIIRTPLGMLTGIDVLAISLVSCLLVWTFYARISRDYKKLVPVKSLKLDIWQLKFLKMSTRFGLLAEICLAFLLLPILRGLSIFRLLRIQCEASVRYHIWLGTTLIFFSTLHGAGTLFIWGINHKVQNMWRWQKEGRIYLAGVIALITALAIWISSLPLVRRRNFDIFFYMHHLYAVFILFFLLHVGDRHFYMVFPGIFLFGLDKLLRVIQSWPATQIQSVRIFPGKIIEMTLPKDPRLKYTPTSIIFIKVPMISKFHWHPFSITSSSTVDDEIISVMIKCQGCWTSSLYNMLNRELESRSQTRHIDVAVEGPYGPASFDFMRYDTLLLIAGGIGLTPMISILKELASAKSSLRNRIPRKIQLIYVTKKSQDVALLNSISHLLLNRSSEFFHLMLKVFVTQEKKSGLSVRELLNEFPTERSILYDTKRPIYIVEPGSLLWMAAFTGISSVLFILSLCFFNHIIMPPEKKSSKSTTPSTVVDLFLLCSFLIALACIALTAMLLRFRNSRKHITSTRDKEDKAMELGLAGAISTPQEHEIHYGNRPMFEELLSKLEIELEGSNVGVVVCGPESMKESVAMACQQRCQALKLVDTKKQPFFVFHSLNFTL